MREAAAQVSEAAEVSKRVAYHVQEDTWSLAEVIQARDPPELVPQPTFAQMGIPMLAHMEPQLQRVTEKYADWTSKLERAILITDEVPHLARPQFSGRARGPQYVKARTAAAPGRAHLADPVAEWWATTRALVKRYHALRSSGKDPEQREVVKGILQARVEYTRAGAFHANPLVWRQSG